MTGPTYVYTYAFLLSEIMYLHPPAYVFANKNIRFSNSKRHPKLTIFFAYVPLIDNLLKNRKTVPILKTLGNAQLVSIANI